MSQYNSELFVYTDQLLYHHISICCNVHRRLVYLVCDGFLYSFCLLAESYETINHYYLIMEWSTLPEMAASQIHSWPLPFEKIENNIFLLILSRLGHIRYQ